jgi:hypothetical protein
MKEFTHQFRSLGLTLEATITHWYPGAPERISGPPEDCYPADPPEVEIAFLRVILPRGEMSATFLLDSDCVEEILEDCIQSILAGE